MPQRAARPDQLVSAALGASAAGLEVFETFSKDMPADARIAFIIQHRGSNPGLKNHSDARGGGLRQYADHSKSRLRHSIQRDADNQELHAASSGTGAIAIGTLDWLRTRLGCVLRRVRHYCH